MPPLSLTQSKYAFAAFGMSVKSVPGCLVAIPPSLIGAPVAFLPLPRPHLAACAAGLAGVLAAAPPPLVDVLSSSPPHAAATIDRPATSARAATVGRSLSKPNFVLTLTLLLLDVTELRDIWFAKRTAVRKPNIPPRLARSQGASGAAAAAPLGRPRTRRSGRRGRGARDRGAGRLG